MLVTILVTILLGALAGYLASIVTNRNDEQGAVGNILIGIAGAFIGTAIFNGLNGSNGTIDFSLGDVVVAFLGAVILCVILNLVQRKRIR